MSNSPQPFEEGAGREISFWFDVEDGEYLPTIAEVAFKFDDDIDESYPVKFLSGVGNYMYTYFTDGKRNVTARVFNTMGEQTITTEINLVVPVTGVHLQAKPGKLFG